MCPICQLIGSLFALISKIDQFGVRAEIRFYLFNTPVIRSMASWPCDVSKCLPERGKYIQRTIFRRALDLDQPYIFILFTKAVLQTPVIEIVVCPLLLYRFYVFFMQLNSKRESVLLTVINLYWLSAFDNDLSVQIQFCLCFLRMEPVIFSSFVF